MKPSLILLFVLIFTKSFAQNVTTPEEQDAIKKVVADEAKFFYAQNAEKWANCYRQTNQTYWARIEKDGTLQKEGWDNKLPKLWVTNKLVYWSEVNSYSPIVLK